MKATSFELPELLREVRTRALYTLCVQVRKPQIVDTSPDGYRRIGVIANGSFEGERLAGEVVEGAHRPRRSRRPRAHAQGALYSLFEIL